VDVRKVGICSRGITSSPFRSGSQGNTLTVADTAGEEDEIAVRPFVGIVEPN